jgi:hypothetical protein
MWPLWLLMTAGMNALFLSADLFNVYVTIELMTLAAIAWWWPRRPAAPHGKGQRADALRAAMRYLLLAMLGSLAYLLGVALLYGALGTLDLYDAAARMAGGDAATLTALALMSAGLLLKGAIFPLHAWLPGAHAQAPGPVSAVLSALVVKTSVYLLYRLWFWSAAGIDREAASWLLGLLGAGAILYGSAAALVQDQLKRVVAYSTVAQLGYLLLVFPLMGQASAWSAAGLQTAEPRPGQGRHVPGGGQHRARLRQRPAGPAGRCRQAGAGQPVRLRAGRRQPDGPAAQRRLPGQVAAAGGGLGRRRLGMDRRACWPAACWPPATCSGCWRRCSANLRRPPARQTTPTRHDAAAGQTPCHGR